MKRFLVMDRASTSASGSRFSGSVYRRVAVVEIDTDIMLELGRDEPAVISERATGVVRVVETWENLYVGTTPDCAFGRAFDVAGDVADALNAKWYAGNPDQVEHDTYATIARVCVAQLGSARWSSYCGRLASIRAVQHFVGRRGMGHSLAMASVGRV